MTKQGKKLMISLALTVFGVFLLIHYWSSIAGWIGEKFCPDHLEGCYQETDEVIAENRMTCVEIEVEHLTGKCGNEVLRRRRSEQ